MYVLDSDQEPSYHLSKNLLLLPRTLKLIEVMVDDSTPLLKQRNICTIMCVILIQALFLSGNIGRLIPEALTHVTSLDRLNILQGSDKFKKKLQNKKIFKGLSCLKKLKYLSTRPAPPSLEKSAMVPARSGIQ